MWEPEQKTALCYKVVNALLFDADTPRSRGERDYLGSFVISATILPPGSLNQANCRLSGNGNGPSNFCPPEDSIFASMEGISSTCI